MGPRQADSVEQCINLSPPGKCLRDGAPVSLKWSSRCGSNSMTGMFQSTERQASCRRRSIEI
ncbi:protein of unknown function (plasmid) [Cupriavidus taiwanensis]|uniref:Uncharacterized protein n=1 Tax=Cupriavidus taiwanensis TaxID=164546 RepID=A0A375IS13_9BURK|nr:protein of unknown function [Cupriavidus taiwanensis]